jgi:large subunit ribosomal protein L29
MTKPAEFRDLGIEDLEQRLREADDQLFRLRLQKSMGQLDSPAKLRALRRDIARMRTILGEKQRETAAG